MNAVQCRLLLAVRCGAVCLLGIVAAAETVSPARAQNVGARLTDGSATFDYTANGAGNLPTAPQGTSGNVAMNFQLDGPPGNAADQQVVKGNWFYRFLGAGNDREFHLANATGRTLIGTDEVRWVFDKVYMGGAASQVPQVWAEMGFKVYDTGPDSACTETFVCFHNDGTTPYDIEVFLAIDFHLAATAANDAYAPVNTSGGRLWTLTDGTWTGVLYGPGAIGSAFGTASNVFGQLTNTSLNTFNPDVLPGGGTVADGAAAVQFSVHLPAQSQFCVPAYLGIGVNGVVPPLVPEPSSLTLLALGATILLRRRGR